MSLRQTTPCAPTVAPVSSFALIPAAIVENAYQRSRRSVVIAKKCAPGRIQSSAEHFTTVHPAQPKHQIAISRALHTAGSFLGDFPTPEGVRNSSRKRNGCFGATERE
jgi:hypothetical protein